MLTRQRLTRFSTTLVKRVMLHTWFFLEMWWTCGGGMLREYSWNITIQLPRFLISNPKELTLTDGPITYRFVHGYEFDPEQKVPLMAFLCRVMSDQGGALENNLWTDFNSLNNIFSKIEPSFVKADLAALTKRLHQRPEDRLKGSLNKINLTACNAVKPGEVLIFGHTHVPFINKAEDVVNSGSWVKDAAIYNTYVELTGGKPRLFVFGGQEITERTDP